MGAVLLLFFTGTESSSALYYLGTSLRPFLAQGLLAGLRYAPVFCVRAFTRTASKKSVILGIVRAPCPLVISRDTWS